MTLRVPAELDSTIAIILFFTGTLAITDNLARPHPIVRLRPFNPSTLNSTVRAIQTETLGGVMIEGPFPLPKQFTLGGR